MVDFPIEKDEPQVQKKRIMHLVSRFYPALKVEFYENRINPNTKYIRFKLVDTSSGVDKIIGSIKKGNEWSSTEIADKSDKELLRNIIAVAPRSSRPF